jgi:hypothetical protein
MALPITIPYTFASATTSIPLSNLDSDFATVVNTINGIGNGTVGLTTITSPAATALTIQSAGTTAMTINTSQNVGIGTTSPGQRLDIQQASTDYQMRIGDAGGNYYDIGRSTGNGLLTFYGNQAAASGYVFSTVNGERMRIDTSGNLLVGTTTGSDRVVIKASGTSSAASAITIQNSAGTELLRVRNDGVVYTGVATYSPYNNTTGAAANVVVNASGDLYRSTSSLRYKINVQNYEKGLSDVAKLRPVTFQSKLKENDEFSSTHTYAGFIAEEVDATGLREFVSYDNEGRPDALHYANMVALMAKAIQELSAKNDALEARLAALEAK